MKKTVDIQITIGATVTIDTDKIEYGIHGGETEPREIVKKAVEYYVNELESSCLPYECDTEEGIETLNSTVIEYQIS